MGNIKELKGYELVQEATRKALNPSQLTRCFHDGCNPEPHNLSTSISSIAFKNIYFSSSFAKLEKWINIHLSELGLISQIISFDEENDMLTIEFGSNDEAELQKALSSLEKNVGKIVQILPNYNFIRK